MPDWHHKRLKLWAYVKGTTKTQLSTNIIQARVEANDDQISKMLEELASDRGITVEELITQILTGDND